MFIRASPPQHKQLMSGHKKLLCRLIDLKSGPHVYQGFFLHNTNNHCLGKHGTSFVNWLQKNYWKTTFMAPCLPLCGHTQPLWGRIDLKLLTENNFQCPYAPDNELSGSHFYQGFPTHNTNNRAVLAHTESLCGLINLKTPLENNFHGPMFTRAHPHITNNHYVGTDNHCLS